MANLELDVEALPQAIDQDLALIVLAGVANKIKEKRANRRKRAERKM